MKSFAAQDFRPAASTSLRPPAPAREAVAADFLNLRALALADRERWARLTARAAPGNIFAADWFMEPALRHCCDQRSLRLAVVRAADGEWLGAFPLVFEGKIGRCPIPSRHSWLATNQFIGIPLVAQGAEKLFWEMLLAALDRRPGMALALCCDGLPLDHPVTLALLSLCAEQGRAVHETERHARPARLPGSPASEAAPGAERRKLDKRLDQLEKRLAADAGPLRLVVHREASESAAWLDAFLALEKAGWKGRSDSALACCPNITGFFREVITTAAERGQVRLASLYAGERIAAMSSWFLDAGHGYGFKMAFDERLRAAAPGRVLMRRAAHVIASEGAELFDTCAPAGTPSDPFWPDRRNFGGFAIPIGSAPRRALLGLLLRAGARVRAARAAGQELAETA